MGVRFLVLPRWRCCAGLGWSSSGRGRADAAWPRSSLAALLSAAWAGHCAGLGVVADAGQLVTMPTGSMPHRAGVTLVTLALTCGYGAPTRLTCRLQGAILGAWIRQP